LVDEFLLRRAQDGPDPAPEVAWAWRRLVATGGRLPISRLAGEVGWSHKHLISRFTQQVGLPPKTAARLVRQFTGASPTAFLASPQPQAQT
jgi:AraC-like DNA-binding protein